MNLESEISPADIAKMGKVLQKRRQRITINRFATTIILATIFFLFAEFIFKDGLLRDFFLNVSAGTYAAGILYLVVERDHIEHENQITIAENMTNYTHRMIQVQTAAQSKIKHVESMIKRAERLKNAIKSGKYQNRSEVEYSVWKLQMDIVSQVEEILYLTSEGGVMLEKAKEIFLGMNSTSEVSKILTLRSKGNRLD